jgi:hypothetical protein
MERACALLCCHLWHDRLYNIFPHYIINGTIFVKTLLNIKCVFQFSLPVRNVSHSKKNSPRYYQKYTYGFMHSTRYSCQILMKLELSRQAFEKYSNTKFQENPSRGRRAVPCARTGGQTDRRNFANAPKD